MRKKIGFLIMVFLFCIGLVACGQKESNETKSKNIKFGLVHFQTNLDPALDWNGWYVYRYGMGETLVKFDKNMNVKPSLSDKWERVDKLNWKFHIRNGVKFHNGDKLTAKGVKDSIERSLRLNKRTQEILHVDSIEADGEYVTIKTKKPYEALLGNLADPLTIIVDTKVKDDKFLTAPVCTGPFKIKSCKENKEVVVEKNNEYWGEKALIDMATFKNIPDANTRSMALQNGEIDVANCIDSNNLSVFEKNEKFKVNKIASLRIIMAYENFDNELLKDPSVRRAIALGIDRESYAKTLLKGTATPAAGPFPESLSYGGYKKVKGYKYDPKEAKKCLEEAGYKDTNGDGILEKDNKKLELRLAYYTTRSELPPIAQAIQAQLKQIGIGVKLECYESIVKVTESKNFDICLYNVNTATSGDPQAFLELYNKTSGSANFGGYSNKEVDKLIDKLDSVSDAKEREKIAIKVQELTLNDNGYIYIASPMLNIVSKKEVKGLEMYPVEYFLLNNKVGI